MIENFADAREIGWQIRAARGFDRFLKLRELYRLIDGDILDAGARVWGCDPYVVDWLSLFTPIEFGMWSDIRGCGAVFYPQYPVDRYFVDFGNPCAKVAIECDGAAFHQDQAKDAKRQRVIESLGWTVYRVPGWKCLEPDEIYDEDSGTYKPNPSRTSILVRDLAQRHGIIR